MFIPVKGAVIQFWLDLTLLKVIIFLFPCHLAIQTSSWMLQSSTAVQNYKKCPKSYGKGQIFPSRQSELWERKKSLNKFGLATFQSCLASAACGYFEYSISELCSVVKCLCSKPIFFLNPTSCGTLLVFSLQSFFQSHFILQWRCQL